MWYVSMVEDYARYGPDIDFVKKKIGGTRQILEYFKHFQAADGSVKNVPYWMFTDWVTAKDWVGGIAPIGKDGSTANVDLQMLLALQSGIYIEQQLGIAGMADSYQTRINQLKQTIRSKYWDASKGLLADRPEKDLFSQHVNAMAILAGITTPTETKNIAQALLTNNQLAPASIYFKYYLHLALSKAGLGNDYLKWLDKWRENINLGLTTWAEMSDVKTSRSDCHAWGSSPNIEFYRTVLGIDSDAVGFTKLKIAPNLGDIKKIGGEIPHPQGKVAVNYELVDDKYKILIHTPVSGKLSWKGKNYALKIGENSFNLK